MAECDRTDCYNQGRWMPVLQLRPKGYHGEPAQAAMALRICDQCKVKLKAKDFISDAGWIQMCAPFVAAGRPAPSRKLTTIKWQKIPVAQDN